MALLRNVFSCSERRACRALGLWRGTIRCISQCKLAPVLLPDLRQLAAERPRFGYRGRTYR